MPLTCILARPSSVSQRFDATDAQDSEWQRVYRVRPRPLLTCPECLSRVHAKVSRRGLRFFAHDQAQRGCSLGGETQEHLHLKRLLAQIIRSNPNWSVVIEAGPMEGDTGGWRADVLATGVEGRRMAFEVQLAAMTVADGIERAGVYERDRVEQVWLTPSNPSWALNIPTLPCLEQRRLPKLNLKTCAWCAVSTDETAADAWNPAEAVRYCLQW
jgi:competence CoiA-like predicted nuclease